MIDYVRKGLSPLSACEQISECTYLFYYAPVEVVGSAVRVDLDRDEYTVIAADGDRAKARGFVMTLGYFSSWRGGPDDFEKTVWVPFGKARTNHAEHDRSFGRAHRINSRFGSFKDEWRGD